MFIFLKTKIIFLRGKSIIRVLLFRFFVMKIQPECVPCLLKRIIFEADQSTSDKKVKNAVIKKGCRLLSELYDPSVCSASIATRVHKAVYDTLDDSDPYRFLKSESNRVAKSLVPYVEKLVDGSDDSLYASMVCSIVGNLMDFGISGGSSSPDDLKSIFREQYEMGLGYDDYEKVKKLLKNSERVLLFTDNCGEIVFDKILCREIKRFNPDVFLTLVVKGEDVLSDATIDDIEELDFLDVVDEVLTTGCFAVGVDFDSLPDDLEKFLESSDFIICKGMANYESFSETSYHPIAYLLRTKCSAIARSMGLKQDINVIKLYE